jgi:cobalt-zinc-cadmium efflux system outer membrane protein
MPISMRAALLAVACVPFTAHAAPLSLDDALNKALSFTLQNEVAAARDAGLSASRRGADTRPAATIDAQSENLGVGGRDLRDQMQFDVAYTQRIERGGKRAARIAFVDRELDVSRAEAVVARLEVAAQAQKLYIEAQSASVALEAAKERVTIARTMAREVGRRVAAARDPLFAGTRARTQLIEAEVEVEVATHERDRCIARLVALWAGSVDGIEIPTADFLELVHVEEEHPPSPPDLAVYEARSAQADAGIALERAQAVPDPSVMVGPRYLVGSGDVALIAGVSIPLSNRNLNRANIDRAEAGRRQAEANLAVERFQREREIDTAAEEVEEAKHAAEAVRDRVLPGLRQTLAEVRDGYARGGFAFLDVSSASSALAEAKSRMIAAATKFHLAQVRLDRLTGHFADIAREAR